jgi:aldehyde dehydrogenase (NAD+)
MNIPALVLNQRKIFTTGTTESVHFRIEQLKKLSTTLHKYENEMLDVLKQDLGKPEKEAYLSEVRSVLGNITYMLDHIQRFIKPTRVKTPWIFMGSQCYTTPEPYGVTLIMAPWNYPLSLVFRPLIGALAAGNCAIVKPSELAPHSAKLISTIIKETFSEDYVAAVAGDHNVSSQLLEQRFDYIFFTGGTNIGRIVMQAAAQHLTPVTLELGGKSPCIVTADTTVALTAKRIAWGKLMNAGQVCIAPDYVLVHKDIKEQLINELKHVITTFYGTDPLHNDVYGKIINEKHFDRITSLMSTGTIVHGGKSDKSQLKIEPTIITNVSWDDPIMQEEIFGPVLPIMEYDRLDNVIALLKDKPKPLAVYLFSQNKATHHKIITQTSSGGICINDTVSYVSIPELPFGGVGDSGMGRYHGKATFDTFSNIKSVLVASRWSELFMRIRYPHVKISLPTLKNLLRW